LGNGIGVRFANVSSCSGKSGWHRKRDDRMEVLVVGGNLEKALRSFNRMVARDGIHLAVRRRNQAPNKTDRRKMKDLNATRRRREVEKKRVRGLKVRRERPYEQEIRRQDLGIKIFERSHRIEYGVKV